MRRTMLALSFLLVAALAPTKEVSGDDSAQNLKADKLLQKAEVVGRQAESENSITKGRRAMVLLREAVTVAPDYIRAWKQYRRGLTDLQSRFGHSLVMSNSKIKRNIRRCDRVLARLHPDVTHDVVP